MSRFTYPYKGATLVRSMDATIGTGPHAGAPIRLELWDGMASHGFRTGYQARPKRWLVLQADTLKDERGRGYRRCWAFSGNRFDKADAEWRRCVSDLELSQLQAVTAQLVAETAAHS